MSQPGSVERPQVTDARQTVIPSDNPIPGGGFWLAVTAIAWLAVALWLTKTGLAGAGAGSVALTETALRLPGVLQAVLLAAVGTSYASVGYLGARLATALTRSVTGLIAGAIIGALAAGAVLLAPRVPGEVEGITALCVGLAGLVGGLLGSLRPAEVVAAALPAVITVTVLDFILKLAGPRLMGLFGAAGTQAEIVSRDGLFLGAKAVAVGLVGGVVAFRILRRTPEGWLGYLIAGAGAGIIAALAEGLARTAGARLYALASGLSPADSTVQAWFGGARLNHALVVFFVGALTAMILYGRTLKPRS